MQAQALMLEQVFEQFCYAMPHYTKPTLHEQECCLVAVNSDKQNNYKHDIAFIYSMQCLANQITEPELTALIAFYSTTNVYIYYSIL